MKQQAALWTVFLAVFLMIGCGGSSSSSDAGDDPAAPIVVNNLSLEDMPDPPAGMVTLRSALAEAADGQAIVFDPDLDGQTIDLSLVGAAHSVLKGEVMGMRDEPSGPVSYLVGYFERDYGRSALYARKDVVIDASALPSGITLRWTGGDADPARVLAVYGDLTLINVSITGGRSVAEDIATGDPDDQPWTLGRGGGVAVWGRARLVHCRLYDNACLGDYESSRDRGAFGGGLYANIVEMEDCVVSGNTVAGGGAAGGGVFSVGGADTYETVSSIENSAITGNRISGLFAYGAGVYSDGGGIGNRKTLELINCTIARNVADPAGLPPFLLGMGYWRGGGAYMSNGHLLVKGCTVVENEVFGVPRTDDLGKPNLAGGIAATIGNAHAVEDMTIGHSVIAGNVVHEMADGGVSYAQDIFTGSLLYFKSMGYNRIGVIDFSQILVPVGEPGWASLCRRHYPKAGDQDGVTADEVLDLAGGVVLADDIVAAGSDPAEPVVLYYTPRGSALDQVPASAYVVSETFAEYELDAAGTDDFLSIVLDRVADHYDLAETFAADFTTDFETFLTAVDLDDETAGNQPYTDPDGNSILTLADALWFGPAVTWPKELFNYPYIEFWHRLDSALADENIDGMGPECLGDDAWAALFASGPLTENGDITMAVSTMPRMEVHPLAADQRGLPRPANGLGDIGAVEIQ